MCDTSVIVDPVFPSRSSFMCPLVLIYKDGDLEISVSTNILSYHFFFIFIFYIQLSKRILQQSNPIVHAPPQNIPRCSTRSAVCCFLCCRPLRGGAALVQQGLCGKSLGAGSAYIQSEVPPSADLTRDIDGADNEALLTRGPQRLLQCAPYRHLAPGSEVQREMYLATWWYTSGRLWSATLIIIMFDAGMLACV